MSSKLLTDAEAHELIMARQASLSREEWQARIDAANEAFDRQAAAERAYARNGSHSKPVKSKKSSYQATAVTGGHPGGTF